MFGSLGGGELVLVLVLALLLFGPRQLPKIGRTLGGALAEFRKATTDFKMNLEREVDIEEVHSVRKDVKSVRQSLSDTVEEVRSAAVPRRDASPRPATPPPVADGPPNERTAPDSDGPTEPES